MRGNASCCKRLTISLYHLQQHIPKYRICATLFLCYFRAWEHCSKLFHRISETVNRILGSKKWRKQQFSLLPNTCFVILDKDGYSRLFSGCIWLCFMFLRISESSIVILPTMRYRKIVWTCIAKHEFILTNEVTGHDILLYNILNHFVF